MERATTAGAAPLGPTPTQRRVLRELFDRGGARPEFPSDLGTTLKAALEEAIADVVAELGPRHHLLLGKRVLAQLHACEGWWAADRQARFCWSPAAARGTVAHKAVELAVTLGEKLAPHELVDLAIDRLIVAGGDWGPRDWLLSAPAAELAELRSAAADWVVKFDDSFPRLSRQWRPRMESGLAVDLAGGKIALRGRVDLALGRPDGTRARVLIVDFKTGLPSRVHVDDLRFYALLETIRVGVPPFRLATFSLDSGSWFAEDVDEQILSATVRRVADAIHKLASLTVGSDAPAVPRPPVLTAGHACRWCPAAASCGARAALDDPYGLVGAADELD